LRDVNWRKNSIKRIKLEKGRMSRRRKMRRGSRVPRRRKVMKNK
jgi:hypothetical protein